MPKFKVLGGFHDHSEPGSPSHNKRFMGEIKGDNGVIIRQGDVLHSKHDLRQDFANKFELVHDSHPLSLGHRIPGSQVEQELAKIEATTPLKPIISTPPPAAPTTMPDNRMETAISGTQAENGADGSDEDETAPTTPQGKEVTKQFTKALEEDYKVFKNGKAPNTTYDVYNADNMAQVASGLERAKVDDAIAADLNKTAKV